jgi:hypothetical protein
MASAFDPSAFIEAEEQALAAASTAAAATAIVAKPAEIVRCCPPAEPEIAAIAAIAAPLPETTPWAAELALFIARPCPADIREDHWDELVNEAEKVERLWGEFAHKAGWSVLDLYGAPAKPLASIYGQSGLVHAIVTLLTPVRLVNVTATEAVLQPFRGPPMKYRPPPRRGSVPLWDAYSMAHGP